MMQPNCFVKGYYNKFCDEINCNCLETTCKALSQLSIFSGDVCCKSQQFGVADIHIALQQVSQ